MTKRYSASALTLALIFLVLILALAATLYVIKQRSASFSNDARTSLIGDKDSQAVYTDILGNEISLESYAGKVLVVNSWASWSPFSREELPLLSELSKEFPAVAFLAINRKEPKNQAERFISSLPPIDGIAVLIDTTDHFYITAGGYAMPETVIYTKNGEISSHIHTPVTPESLRESINKAISGS